MFGRLGYVLVLLLGALLDWLTYIPRYIFVERHDRASWFWGPRAQAQVIHASGTADARGAVIVRRIGCLASPACAGVATTTTAAATATGKDARHQRRTRAHHTVQSYGAGPAVNGHGRPHRDAGEALADGLVNSNPPTLGSSSRSSSSSRTRGRTRGERALHVSSRKKTRNSAPSSCDKRQDSTWASEKPTLHRRPTSTTLCGSNESLDDVALLSTDVGVDRARRVRTRAASASQSNISTDDDIYDLLKLHHYPHRTRRSGDAVSGTDEEDVYGGSVSETTSFSRALTSLSSSVSGRPAGGRRHIDASCSSSLSDDDDNDDASSDVSYSSDTTSSSVSETEGTWTGTSASDSLTATGMDKGAADSQKTTRRPSKAETGFAQPVSARRATADHGPQGRAQQPCHHSPRAQDKTGSGNEKTRKRKMKDQRKRWQPSEQGRTLPHAAPGGPPRNGHLLSGLFSAGGIALTGTPESFLCVGSSSTTNAKVGATKGFSLAPHYLRTDPTALVVSLWQPHHVTTGPPPRCCNGPPSLADSQSGSPMPRASDTSTVRSASGGTGHSQVEQQWGLSGRRGPRRKMGDAEASGETCFVIRCCPSSQRYDTPHAGGRTGDTRRGLIPPWYAVGSRMQLLFASADPLGQLTLDLLVPGHLPMLSRHTCERQAASRARDDSEGRPPCSPLLNPTGAPETRRAYQEETILADPTDTRGETILPPEQMDLLTVSFFLAAKAVTQPCAPPSTAAAHRPVAHHEKGGNTPTHADDRHDHAAALVRRLVRPLLSRLAGAIPSPLSLLRRLLPLLLRGAEWLMQSVVVWLFGVATTVGQERGGLVMPPLVLHGNAAAHMAHQLNAKLHLSQENVTGLAAAAAATTSGRRADDVPVPSFAIAAAALRPAPGTYYPSVLAAAYATIFPETAWEVCQASVRGGGGRGDAGPARMQAGVRWLDDSSLDSPHVPENRHRSNHHHQTAVGTANGAAQEDGVNPLSAPGTTDTTSLSTTGHTLRDTAATTAIPHQEDDPGSEAASEAAFLQSADASASSAPPNVVFPAPVHVNAAVSSPTFAAAKVSEAVTTTDVQETQATASVAANTSSAAARNPGYTKPPRFASASPSQATATTGCPLPSVKTTPGSSATSSETATTASPQVAKDGANRNPTEKNPATRSSSAPSENGSRPPSTAVHGNVPHLPAAHGLIIGQAPPVSSHKPSPHQQQFSSAASGAHAAAPFKRPPSLHIKSETAAAPRADVVAAQAPCSPQQQRQPPFPPSTNASPMRLPKPTGASFSASTSSTSAPVKGTATLNGAGRDAQRPPHPKHTPHGGGTPTFSSASSTPTEYERCAGIEWQHGRCPDMNTASPVVLLLLCPSVVQGGQRGHVMRRLSRLCECLSVVGTLRHNSDSAARAAHHTRRTYAWEDREEEEELRLAALREALREPSYAQWYAGIVKASMRPVLVNNAESEQEGMNQDGRLWGAEGSGSGGVHGGTTGNTSTGSGARSEGWNIPVTRFDIGNIIAAQRERLGTVSVPTHARTPSHLRDPTAAASLSSLRAPEPRVPKENDPSKEEDAHQAFMRLLPRRVVIVGVGWSEGAGPLLEHAITLGPASGLDGLFCISHTLSSNFPLVPDVPPEALGGGGGGGGGLGTWEGSRLSGAAMSWQAAAPLLFHSQLLSKQSRGSARLLLLVTRLQLIASGVHREKRDRARRAGTSTAGPPFRAKVPQGRPSQTQHRRRRVVGDLSPNGSRAGSNLREQKEDATMEETEGKEDAHNIAAITDRPVFSQFFTNSLGALYKVREAVNRELQGLDVGTQVMVRQQAEADRLAATAPATPPTSPEILPTEHKGTHQNRHTRAATRGYAEQRSAFHDTDTGDTIGAAMHAAFTAGAPRQPHRPPMTPTLRTGAAHTPLSRDGSTSSFVNVGAGEERESPSGSGRVVKEAGESLASPGHPHAPLPLSAHRLAAPGYALSNATVASPLENSLPLQQLQWTRAFSPNGQDAAVRTAPGSRLPPRLPAIASALDWEHLFQQQQQQQQQQYALHGGARQLLSEASVPPAVSPPGSRAASAGPAWSPTDPTPPHTLPTYAHYSTHPTNASRMASPGRYTGSQVPSAPLAQRQPSVGSYETPRGLYESSPLLSMLQPGGGHAGQGQGPQVGGTAARVGLFSATGHAHHSMPLSTPTQRLSPSVATVDDLAEMANLHTMDGSPQRSASAHTSPTGLPGYGPLAPNGNIHNRKEEANHRRRRSYRDLFGVGRSASTQAPQTLQPPAQPLGLTQTHLSTDNVSSSIGSGMFLRGNPFMDAESLPQTPTRYSPVGGDVVSFAHAYWSGRRASGLLHAASGQDMNYDVGRAVAASGTNLSSLASLSQSNPLDLSTGQGRSNPSGAFVSESPVVAALAEEAGLTPMHASYLYEMAMAKAVADAQQAAAVAAAAAAAKGSSKPRRQQQQQRRRRRARHGRQARDGTQVPRRVMSRHDYREADEAGGGNGPLADTQHHLQCFRPAGTGNADDLVCLRPKRTAAGALTSKKEIGSSAFEAGLDDGTMGAHRVKGGVAGQRKGRRRAMRAAATAAGAAAAAAALDPAAIAAAAVRTLIELRVRSSQHVCARLTLPTLFLHAADDDVAPLTTLPLQPLAANPDVILVLTRRGGHGVFMEHMRDAWRDPQLVALTQDEGQWPLGADRQARKKACRHSGTTGEGRSGPVCGLRVEGTTWMEQLLIEFVASATLTNTPGR